MNTHDYIKRNYHSLSNGESANGSGTGRCFRADVLGDAPARCDLGVVREGNILKYNCFSASCTCRGIATLEGRRSMSIRKADRTNDDGDRKTIDFPVDAIHHLPRYCVKYLEDNNVSSGYARSFGACFSRRKNALIIPISDGVRRDGFIIRRIDGDGIQESQGAGYCLKSKWYRFTDVTCLPFFNAKGNVLYIVESVLSAMAMNEKLGVPVVATLGVNIDSSKLKAIKTIWERGAYDNICFIPDPDVSKKKKIYLKKLLTNNVGRCIVKTLSNKPRYVLEEI